MIQSKLYRLFALIFAVAGIVMFLILYMKFYNGDVMKALADPASIALVLFPFVPAAVLSWIASRAEKKLEKMISDQSS